MNGPQLPPDSSAFAGHLKALREARREKNRRSRASRGGRRQLTKKQRESIPSENGG